LGAKRIEVDPINWKPLQKPNVETAA